MEEKTTLKQTPCFCFCKTEKALGTGNNRLQQEWFFQTLICQRTAALQLSWMVLAKHLKGTKEDANIWRQIVTTGNLCRWLNNRGGEKLSKVQEPGLEKQGKTKLSIEEFWNSSVFSCPNKDASTGWFWSYSHQTNALLQAVFERHLQLQLLWNNEIYTVP